MKKTENIELGLRIKLIRSELGMDQKEFSELIGSTVSALSNWENGRNRPRLDMIKKIAYEGEIDYKSLLHGDLETYIIQNLSNCFPKHDTHLLAHVSKETLNNIVKKMEKLPNSYDLNALKKVVQDQYHSIEMDFLKDVAEAANLTYEEIKISILMKDISELSRFAKKIASCTFNEPEQALKTLFSIAGINSSNFPSSTISEKLPISKNTVRLLRFDRDKEVQIDTETKSYSEFLDLNHLLDRSTRYAKYSSSEDKLQLDYTNMPITYKGHELTGDQIVKIKDYLDSLI